MMGAENKVKVIERERPENKGAAKIEFLQNGSLCDVVVGGTNFLFCVQNDESSDSYLYSMDLISQECNQLTQIEGIIGYQAKYSPDGSKIAVSALSRDAKRSLPNFIVDLNTPDISRIVCDNEVAVFENAPMYWSPEGDYITATGWNKKGNLIVILDSEGKEIVCIDESLYKDESYKPKTFDKPVFFFDESRIIYNSGEKIVLKDINKVELVPEEIVHGGNFVVSPNRKSIAYLSEVDANKRHIKIDLLGTDMKVLYTAAEFDLISALPVFKWSPDSKNITYYSENSLWHLNIETREKKQLTTDMGIVKQLYWIDNNSFIFETLKNSKREIYKFEFESMPKNQNNYTKTPDILKLDEKLRVLQSEATKEFCESILEVKVSSELGGDYSVDKLTDRKLDSAWVEGQSGLGEGQYVEFLLKDITLNRLGIINGYRKSEYLYTANSKLKKARVEVDSVVRNLNTGKVEKIDHTEKIVEFLDRGYYDESVDLLFHCSDFEPVGRNSIRLVSKIKITILEAYKGAKYDDTCISEVIILGK